MVMTVWQNQCSLILATRLYHTVTNDEVPTTLHVEDEMEISMKKNQSCVRGKEQLNDCDHMTPTDIDEMYNNPAAASDSLLDRPNNSKCITYATQHKNLCLCSVRSQSTKPSHTTLSTG